MAICSLRCDAQRPLRAGLLRRRRPDVPAADSRDHRVRVAQPVCPATCSSSTRRRGHGDRLDVHDHRFAQLQGRSEASRHQFRDVVIAVNFAKRLVLIGGTSYAGEMKKSIFTIAQLPPAAAGRALDALLGQHRPGGRRGAVLRPVGHRQDDAVERSRTAADRRRRARLERSRRLQLRRRLLREDDPAVRRGRAADLRDDAPVRHRARERGRRSATRARWISTTTGYTENTRAAYPISFIDNAEPSGQGGHPEERRHADRRRVRRAAADLASDAGGRDVSLPVGLHRQGRGHREGRAPNRQRRSAPASARRSCRCAPSRYAHDARRAHRRARRRACGW